jgi:hypothetical protein
MPEVQRQNITKTVLKYHPCTQEDLKVFGDEIYNSVPKGFDHIMNCLDKGQEIHIYRIGDANY